jgi:excisionase family DNA binding protein
MTEDRLLTKKEVIEYLRISRATLDRSLMKEIPYIKLGKRVLFRKSDIEKYLETKLVTKKVK